MKHSMDLYNHFEDGFNYDINSVRLYADIQIIKNNKFLVWT